MRTANKHISIYNKTHKKLLSLIVTLILCMGLHSHAQTAAEYQVKAVFLFNFTRFVDWPGPSFESPNSPFVIGILGNDPFGAYIDTTVNGEKVDGHTIIIKRYRNIKEIDNCHILFISTGDGEQIKAMLPDLKQRHILTVSDANNFASLGGIIGFFMENNKIRMQINMEAARASSLNISSKLLGVAKIL